MQLCMFSSEHFEETLNNAQWRKVKKCNQCDFASSQAGDLRKHFKTHSGEKSNKCNQCDFASSQPGHLRKHLKSLSGEKSNKCSQCDFACSDPSSLMRHTNRHRAGEKWPFDIVQTLWCIKIDEININILHNDRGKLFCILQRGAKKLGSKLMMTIIRGGVKNPSHGYILLTEIFC